MSSMKTKIYYLMEKKNATTWSGFTLSSENAREVAKSIKKRNQSVPLSLHDCWAGSLAYPFQLSVKYL